MTTPPETILTFLLYGSLNTAPCNVFVVEPGINLARPRSIMEFKHEQDRSSFCCHWKAVQGIRYIKEGKKHHEAPSPCTPYCFFTPHMQQYNFIWPAVLKCACLWTMNGNTSVKHGNIKMPKETFRCVSKCVNYVCIVVRPWEGVYPGDKQR